MKICESCGYDITHHTHGSVRYCQEGDVGYKKCRRERDLKAKAKRGLMSGKSCPICGDPVNSPYRESCSNKCAARLRNKRRIEALESAEKDKQRQAQVGEVENVDENETWSHWPYKMPQDQTVTPSQMCPLG